MKLIVLSLLTIYTSCLVPDPETAITRRVEDAGAGNLRAASLDSMLYWMELHPRIALELQEPCRDRLNHPPSAHWIEQTEGRTCRAVVHGAEIAILKGTHFVAVN